MQERIRASSLHLLISVVIIVSVLAFVLLICYPGPYFKAMGVAQMLILLAGVDVCLGPLITFVIFDPAKRWLKFELGFVAVLQLSALAYGAVTVFVGRPAYLVFDENRFMLVSAYQIPEIELKKMHYPTLPMTGPKLVGVRIPATREERKKYIAEVLEEHIDLPRMLQYHLPYEAVATDVKAKMLPLDTLLKMHSSAKLAEAKTVLNEAVLKSRLHFDEIGFVPMIVRDNIMTALVRRSDASIVSILPIDPTGS